jgi:hypothetical protein
MDGVEQPRLTAGILSMFFDLSARGLVSPELPAGSELKEKVNLVRVRKNLGSGVVGDRGDRSVAQMVDDAVQHLSFVVEKRRALGLGEGGSRSE